MQKQKNKQRGVTLIALVVSIIVLIILVGVSIAMLVGENGIIKQAQRAKEETEQAAKDEKIILAKTEDSINQYVEGIKPGEIVIETKKDNYTDIEGNKAIVPAGFVVSKIPEEQKISSGLVIYDIPQEELNSVNWTNKNEDGSYNVQTEYNQFVWIPCTLDGENGNIKYDRYTFSRENWVNSQTKGEYDIASNSYKIIRADAPTVYDYEELSKIEENSIQIYNGYYIGRYEAGISSENPRSSPDIEATAEDIESISGKVLVQKEKYVYDNVTIEQAKGLAKNLYTISVESRLCSSYAWDTALKFIEIKDDSYPTNSVGGNYNNILEKTGYDKRHLCNIYDMGGNAGEYTTEICSSLANPNVNRGGYFGQTSEYGPAGYRSSASDAHANTGTTFRITLYIK